MPRESAEHFRRISVLIREDQHERVVQADLNMSGLIRGLLDDHFSDERIVFSVSPRAKDIYRTVVSNFGAEDKDLESYFLEALDKFLESKTRQIDELRRTIKSD